MDNQLRDMHERLVDHLDGIDSLVEQVEVEGLIASDPTWTDAWEKLLETKEALRHFGLRQRVNTIHQEHIKGQGAYRRMLRPTLSIAAALILIVAGYWFFRVYSLSAEKVFQQHYSSYDMGTLRDVTSGQDSVVTFFKQKEYREALAFYGSRAANIHQDIFLAGMAAMELKNYVKAKELFTTVLSGSSGPDISFRDESQYYLALACIETKDYDQALELLRMIREDKNHRYHDQVTQSLVRDVKWLKWK
jgi:tetratricopeptide (TPR) repeat protein